jgi:hypothetical protein
MDTHTHVCVCVCERETERANFARKKLQHFTVCFVLSNIFYIAASVV